MNDKYGLILKDEFEPQEFILGGGELPRLILEPDGQWDAWMPPDEIQNRYVEPYNCTAYGSLSAIEALIYRKYGWKIDYSERALGIMAGTRPPGNDPHAVLETIRKRGLVLDATLPYTSDIDTIEEYYADTPQFKEITLPVIDKEGNSWLQTFLYGHEWLWNRGSTTLEQKKAKIREALKCSPVNVSVYAWNPPLSPAQDGGEGRFQIYEKEPGQIDNHWTTLYGEESLGWKCFDSYDDTHKLLEAGFDFTVGKRHHIELKGPPPTAAEKTGLLAILRKLAEILGLLSKASVAHSELAVIAPEIVPDVKPLPPPAQPFEWTKDGLISMIRAVCHNFYFTHEETAEILAGIEGESGFDIHAVNPKTGNYANGSRDYGLCQFNTSSTGAGWYAKLITPEQANDPEFAVNLMCKQWSKGRKNDWNAVKSGAYKQHIQKYL